MLLSYSQRANRSPACLQNQPRLRVLIQRPDRTLHFGLGNASVIARDRPVRIDVEHVAGDRPVGCHEVVRALHNHESPSGRFHADVA